MKTQVITCDRCGVGIGLNFVLPEYRLHRESNEDFLDLCFTCQKELTEFMLIRKKVSIK